MHEMTIALGIIDIVNKSAFLEKAKVVNEIELEIGSLSGIELDALTFALETACTGTWLEKTVKKILVTEATGLCKDCGFNFKIESYFNQCPKCKSYGLKIEKGEELRVKSISID